MPAHSILPSKVAAATGKMCRGDGKLKLINVATKQGRATNSATTEEWSPSRQSESTKREREQRRHSGGLTVAPTKTQETP